MEEQEETSVQQEEESLAALQACCRAGCDFLFAMHEELASIPTLGEHGAEQCCCHRVQNLGSIVFDSMAATRAVGSGWEHPAPCPSPARAAQLPKINFMGQR